MDPRINCFDPISSLFISPQELCSCTGYADAPLLLDVRPQARFDASARMLMGAQRYPFDQIPAFAAAWLVSNPQQEVATSCVYGHHVSQQATAALRAAGLNARTLAGGLEGGLEGGVDGGESGVDSAQNIAQWRNAVFATMAKGQP